MKEKTLAIVFVVLTHIASAVERRDLLMGEADQIDLSEVLVLHFSDLGFPGYKEREFWDSIPDNIREQYIAGAEKVLEYPWPALKATDFLAIIRSGDRRGAAFKTPLRVLNAVIMGELVEGEGRFLDQIINGAWYFCEQTWWGRSAHLKMQAAPHGLPDVQDPVIDLGVGDVAYTLSWAWYLFKKEFDAIHPLIAVRIRDEVMKKALVPYYEREDMWWMGFDGTRPKLNNWTPHITYSILTAMLILEEDRLRQFYGIRKALRSVDIFLNGYPEDGGCDEGPSYWGKAGGGLYKILDLLHRATDGAFDVFDHALIENIGQYIYKAYIDYPYFTNFSDADAIMGSRPFLIYCYGRDIKDPVMQRFGAFLAKEQMWGKEAPGGKIDEQILKLMHLEEVCKATAENALIPEFWLPETEIGGGRDKGGASEGFYFAAKGSHNGESHNHNDVGTCVLYYNGKPCLIDLGRQTYTAKTFGDRRYEIWTMQSQYHNVPLINGVPQQAGIEFRARNTSFVASKRSVELSTEISGAYPAEAQVKSWVRSYRLTRAVDFRIRDIFELEKRTDRPTTLNLMTSCKVTSPAPGLLLLQGADFCLQLQYEKEKVQPTVEYIEVRDENLKRDWPEGVTRIMLQWTKPGRTGSNEIVLKRAG